MAFVISSNEWDFHDLSTEIISNRLEALLDRVSAAYDREEEIYVGNDLQSKDVCDGMDLWTFLSSPDLEDVDRGVLEELAVFLNSATYYENDETIWPNNFPNFSVVDKDGHNVGLDMEFAHMNLQMRIPVGCLTISDCSTLETTSEEFGSHKICLINSEANHKKFWRESALNLIRDTAQNLELLSPHMYPNLTFFNEVWNGVNRFEGGYSRVSKQLQKYLSCLDDFGAWVFTEPPPATHPTDTVERHQGQDPTNAIIEERFSGLGITMAPEKPNVRNDTDCYNARTINFESVITKNKFITLYCEWHGKLELHTNRIHVHAPIEDSNGKVIVAIYHKHLPLP